MSQLSLVVAENENLSLKLVVNGCLLECFALEKRKKWAAEAIAQYPNKFPLIIERADDKNTQSKLSDMANPK